MAGISSKAAGVLENRTKYNGIEFDEDLDIDSYEAFYRNLDPQTGRWWQIDPMCEPNEDPNEIGLESLSPYNSMANDPIKKSDPLGDSPCCVEAAQIIQQTDILVSQIIQFGGGPSDAVTDAVAVVVGVGGLIAAGISALWEISKSMPAKPPTTVPKAGTLTQQPTKPAVPALVQTTKKGPKDLVADGKAAIEKAAAEKARAAQRQQQSAQGKLKEGNSNKGTRGSHDSGGRNRQKHDAAEARRAREQKAADAKKEAEKKT